MVLKIGLLQDQAATVLNIANISLMNRKQYYITTVSRYFTRADAKVH